MTTADERYRALLERIDPTIRKARLEEARNQREQQFMAVYADLHSQEGLVKRHRNALVGMDEKSPTYAQAALVVEQSEENLRQLRLLTDHLAEELEAVLTQLEEIRTAGLPKTDTARLS